MSALSALRHWVKLLAIGALLLHASAPALHARLASGHDAEWAEVCAGSGGTVLVLVDATTRERATLPADDPSAGKTGDHHCPQCLTYANSAAAASSGSGPVALATDARRFEKHHAVDRQLAWAAERSRAPPPNG